jgi:hypothetical protein
MAKYYWVDCSVTRYVGSASVCCEAGPSSILDSADPEMMRKKSDGPRRLLIDV